MRILVFFLTVFLLQVPCGWAQNIRAGWFVSDNLLVEDEESTELKEDVAQEEKVYEEEKKIEEAEQEKEAESEVKPAEETISSVADDPVIDNIRFARNNKDLNLAKEWLKYELRQNKDHNIVLSPLGFYNIALLLANGVVDSTLYEFSNIFSVLRLSDVNQQLSKYINERKNNIALNNSVWGKTFSEHYQKLVKEQLNVEVWGLGQNTEPINNWANVRTEGMIESVTPVFDVHSEDLFLADVVYFNKEWKQLFSVDGVKDIPFTGTDGKTNPVKMITAQGIAVDYYEDEEMQAVRLFYQTDDYITFFLPKKDKSFADFADGLDIHMLKPNFKREVIDLSFPDFNLEYGVENAKDAYKMLGVLRVFERGNTDFAKMISYDVPAHVENIYFKTKMSVGKKQKPSNDSKQDSDGAEVAPRTSLNSFIADRPFIFMINNGDLIGAYVKAE